MELLLVQCKQTSLKPETCISWRCMRLIFMCFSFIIRLTFFICSVGFTSPMLFDERKYPYHLMLQKFFCSGGHDALFE